MRFRRAPRLVLCLFLSAAAALRAAVPVLTEDGVACALEGPGTLTLGLPALDGRGTHAPVLKGSVRTDGKELEAAYGPPFEGVTLSMKVGEDGGVRYHYAGLPPDLRLAMCQFNLAGPALHPAPAVRFDGGDPRAIPEEPGKTNDAARVASVNASKVEIAWPGGAMLALASPLCWHGIQDARVWGKGFVGVCLTPPLVRDVPQGDAATFVLTFSTPPQAATASASAGAAGESGR